MLRSQVGYEDDAGSSLRAERGRPESQPDTGSLSPGVGEDQG